MSRSTKNSLGSKSKEILQFIYDTVQEKGFPPSVREICSAVGLASTSTVHGHLNRLERRGLLDKASEMPRALHVTKAGREVLGIKPDKIPLIGTVAAGLPITAEQNIEDYYPVPSDFKADAGNLFMLKVQGTSMINIGILNGDYVIVREQNTAENGEVVVAMTEDNEATVKRFFKEKGHYRLQPENDNMDPIILPKVTVLGKVVGVLRTDVE